MAAGLIIVLLTVSVVTGDQLSFDVSKEVVKGENITATLSLR